MIQGIGIDIVELNRIEQLVGNKKFVERILTENERKSFYSLSDQRKVEYLAGRFSAKEAFAKARGTGIGKELSFLDIEIGNNSLGKPTISAGDQQEIIHLSISHSRDYAVSQVIIES